jgi:hypothetical protein
MRLQWKGRSYRPATNFVRVYKPDVNELMKPLSMKSGLGSAILTGQYISGDGTESDEPVVSPSPTATAEVTPTPSITPTNTLTPSVTPSSTPFPFIQPSLWFDASDSTTMNLILSGGTTYISQLTSKGTSNWTLTGQTSDRYPTYSASTSLPGSPNIIRFTPNATTSLRKALVAFDRPTLTHTGSTLFMVWSQPAGTPAFQNQLYSGNTNGTLAQSGTDTFDRLQFATIGTNIANTNLYPQSSSQSVSIPAPFSATNLNGKYLMKVVLPANPGYGSWELNQSGGTGASLFTGTTVTPQWNAINLGCTSNNTQQLFFTNTNIELAEMMVYNSELTSAEQEAVELYLRDKWRYDEWASPVPTPTATPQVTTTPTPSFTPTNTITPTTTQTPSSTPPAFSPSGVTDLQYWFMADSGATVSSWTNYGLLGGSATQTVALNQGQIITGATLGSYTGTAVQFDNGRDFYTANTASISTTSHTSYLVYKPYSSSASGWAVGTKTGSTYTWYYQNYAGATSGVTRNQVGEYRTFRNTAAQLIISSGSTDLTASRNDVLGVSGSTTASSATTANLLEFGYDAGGSISQGIQVFEWVFFNKVLSASEHTDMVNYLKTKYQYSTW